LRYRKEQPNQANVLRSLIYNLHDISLFVFQSISDSMNNHNTAEQQIDQAFYDFRLFTYWLVQSLCVSF